MSRSTIFRSLQHKIKEAKETSEEKQSKSRKGTKSKVTRSEDSKNNNVVQPKAVKADSIQPDTVEATTIQPEATEVVKEAIQSNVATTITNDDNNSSDAPTVNKDFQKLQELVRKNAKRYTYPNVYTGIKILFTAEQMLELDKALKKAPPTLNDSLDIIEKMVRKYFPEKLQDANSICAYALIEGLSEEELQAKYGAKT